MKKLLVVFLFVGFAGSVFAFDIASYPPPIKSGNIMLDAGIGLGFSGYGSGKLKVPPLFAQVDYALPNIPITLGGHISYYQYAWETGYTSYNWTYTWNFLGLFFRANWHWGFEVNWLDLYSGLNLGYRVFWEKVEYPSGYTGAKTEYNYSGFDWGLTLVGARFYFTDKIGAMVELGYPHLRAGITFKF
jgi:hypothetical protein